jgi:Cu/Ag efflux protein CusF
MSSSCQPPCGGKIIMEFRHAISILALAGALAASLATDGATPRRALAQTATDAPAVLEGVGVVIATVPRMGRLIVHHEEIEGFMAEMEMSYPVTRATLLDGLNPGDRIRFTIDPAAARVTGIDVVERAK